MQSCAVRGKLGPMLIKVYKTLFKMPEFAKDESEEEKRTPLIPPVQVLDLRCTAADRDGREMN